MECPIQNSNQMASRLTTSASFPSVVFQVLQFSGKLPSSSAHRVALMAKTDLSFPVFSIIVVDFAVQFCFRCKCSFHEKRLSSQLLTVARSQGREGPYQDYIRLFLSWMV